MDQRRKFGNRGEDLAAVFFISKGFEIVERNWNCRAGEIDLICKKRGVTHFVEVKTRRSLVYGYPEEAITPTKLRHLRRAIEAYLASLRCPPARYQIDVLAIIAESGKAPEFRYIENVE
ncbi:YraN family protein [Patescibacteria group bacterium]|nr:YraN family protein [Patescibacteria group bacterium]MBU1629799.1 YraN family protein [Patescibacteria group bacterium]MBU1907774.1 YraN family protein [Patescibacteria group bacterium]